MATSDDLGGHSRTLAQARRNSPDRPSPLVPLSGHKRDGCGPESRSGSTKTSVEERPATAKPAIATSGQLRRRRSSPTVALLTLGLLLVGCGSARLSKSVYEQRLQKEGAALANVHVRLSRRPSSLTAQASRIENAQVSLRRVATDLARLTPPRLVVQEHTGLVEGVRAFTAELKPLSLAAKRRDPRLAQETAAVLRRSIGLKQIEQAANRLEQHGYNIGRLPQ